MATREMSGEVALDLCGECVQLLPGRGLYLPATRTLVVADVHLGKAAAFRSQGIAVPEGNTAADLAELTRWISLKNATELLICGDLFHAPAAQSQAVLEMVRTWRAEHAAVAVRLVIGNHDRGPALPRPETGVEVCGVSLERPPFHFVHDPADVREHAGWSICGHLHPAVVLPAGRVRPLRAACFWFCEARRTLVLPGFGSFTGGVAIRPAAGDRIFAVSDGAVRLVPPVLWRGGAAKSR